MNHSTRAASLGRLFSDSSNDTATPLQGTSKQCDSNLMKKHNSLRRCKSNPEKIVRKQRQEVNPHEWLRSLDKERGYVIDLIADEQPIQVQPQFSYFSYLGKNGFGRGRYQYRAISEDTQTVINLGNAIYFQNRTNPQSLDTLPEVIEIQRNPDKEPIKRDSTELLECCTCICCVKALFYHCTKDREMERNWADEPCACERPGIECATRWVTLGILVPFFPCLLCYPILNGCCNPYCYFKRKWEP